MSNISFPKGVVCDDIRQENNGKYLIIGMYSDSFVPNRFPVATQLAFGVWATVEKAGNYTCDFEVVIEPDGTPVGGIKAEFKMEEGQRDAFIPLPPLSVNIGSNGHIILNEKISGKEIIRLKIANPSSAPQQPT